MLFGHRQSNNYHQIKSCIRHKQLHFTMNYLKSTTAGYIVNVCFHSKTESGHTHHSAAKSMPYFNRIYVFKIDFPLCLTPNSPQDILSKTWLFLLFLSIKIPSIRKGVKTFNVKILVWHDSAVLIDITWNLLRQQVNMRVELTEENKGFCNKDSQRLN